MLIEHCLSLKKYKWLIWTQEFAFILLFIAFLKLFQFAYKNHP